jgi:hypothetical protein
LRAGPAALLLATLVAPAPARADPPALRVALRQCPRPRIDRDVLLRLLRVEFTDARVPVTFAGSSPSPSPTAGADLRVLVLDCARAPAAYTLHLSYDDRESLLGVDLGDVAAAQRGRALALAIAEFVRSETRPPPVPVATGVPVATTPVAPARPRPRPPARGARVSATGFDAPRWIAALGLETRGSPDSVAARGVRLGLARRVGLPSARLYLEASARLLFAAPTDPLGSADLAFGELALGPRLRWSRARWSWGAGLHLAAGAACAAGVSTRAEVVTRTGCVATVRAGAAAVVAVRLAGPLALWSEAGASWQLVGLDARAGSPAAERSVGRLAGVALTAAAGVAWEFPP